MSLLHNAYGAYRFFDVRIHLYLQNKDKIQASCEVNILIIHNFIQCTFFVNLSVLISMNEAVIALKYDCFVLNVTRPDPIGYLYLSVSIPKIIYFY